VAGLGGKVRIHIRKTINTSSIISTSQIKEADDTDEIKGLNGEDTNNKTK